MRGIISKIFDWMKHPANSNTSILDWSAGLVLILMVSFLWATVVKQTVD